MSVGHYCGLFGALGYEDAVHKTYFGLQTLLLCRSGFETRCAVGSGFGRSGGAPGEIQ